MGRFPWWGWLALFWSSGCWFLAWTRFEWMQAVQAHTFAPLWIGYIVVVNALTYRRTGRCMLLHRPRYVLSLFPLSACFWWFFEYLNRFVQNWHYVGGGELSAWEYLVRATLPFSTVLPAVLGTAEWLSSFPRLSAGLDRFVTFEFKNHTTWGWGLLIGSAVGLFGIGLWPDYLFSLVWVAPLLLITSLQLIRDDPTICSGTAQGDWRTLWAAALAALICGWFWEMWNFYSLARWEYAVPFVQRFKLFEMPLLRCRCSGMPATCRSGWNVWLWRTCACRESFRESWPITVRLKAAPIWHNESPRWRSADRQVRRCGWRS